MMICRANYQTGIFLSAAGFESQILPELNNAVRGGTSVKATETTEQATAQPASWVHETL